MKDTNRLKLSNWQLFWHYSIIVVFLLVPVIDLYPVLHNTIGTSYTKVTSSAKEVLLWLIVATILAIIQYRKLNFKILNACLTSEEFKSIAKQAGKEMQWIFMTIANDYVVATTVRNWGSWGERITIIRKEKEILINSICDPDRRPSATSWGQNKKNINAFKSKIKSESENEKSGDQLAL